MKSEDKIEKKKAELLSLSIECNTNLANFIRVLAYQPTSNIDSRETGVLNGFGSEVVKYKNKFAYILDEYIDMLAGVEIDEYEKKGKQKA